MTEPIASAGLQVVPVLSLAMAIEFGLQVRYFRESMQKLDNRLIKSIAEFYATPARDPGKVWTETKKRLRPFIRRRLVLAYAQFTLIAAFVTLMLLNVFVEIILFQYLAEPSDAPYLYEGVVIIVAASMIFVTIVPALIAAVRAAGGIGLRGLGEYLQTDTMWDDKFLREHFEKHPEDLQRFWPDPPSQPRAGD